MDAMLKLAPGGEPLLAHLSDEELLRDTRRLVGRSNQLLAALLFHLAEIEARGLHRKRRCASLYTYCIYELRFSEDAAARRSAAARIVKQFPLVLEYVGDGAIHLTGLLMIAPHLTVANHAEVLARAKFRTKQEIGKLVRELSPPPTVVDAVEPLGLFARRRRALTWGELAAAREGPFRELPVGERPQDWTNDEAEHTPAASPVVTAQDQRRASTPAEKPYSNAAALESDNTKSEILSAPRRGSVTAEGSMPGRGRMPRTASPNASHAESGALSLNAPGAESGSLSPGAPGAESGSLSPGAPCEQPPSPSPGAPCEQPTSPSPGAPCEQLTSRSPGAPCEQPAPASSEGPCERPASASPEPEFGILASQRVAASMKSDAQNDGCDVGANSAAGLGSATSSQQYQVRFTTNGEHVQLIERARRLLSQGQPVSLAEVHLRALRLLVADLEAASGTSARTPV